jgi:hypothetical protein
MKSTIKILGIIALVAVIGFSFVACGGGDGGGGGGDKVVLTMKFEQNGDWAKPGNEDWAQWIYNHKEKDPFDLDDMFTNDKVYVFTYSFKSNVDIDSFCTYFFNMDDVNWDWKMISEWTSIKRDIKKNTTYSGRVAIIPKEDAVDLLPEFTSLRFDVMNRDVPTQAILSFYQFSLEQVDKETPGISVWTVSDETFQISDTYTFAEIKTSFEGKSNVLHIKPTYNASSYNADFVISYDLSEEYAGKKIEIVMSMDVYLKKPARIAWQINSKEPYYPVVCGTVAPTPDNRLPYHSGPALSANTWHTISGSNIITVPDSDSDDAGKILYLSGPQIDGAEAYFANATFTVTEDDGDNTAVTLNTVTVEGTPTNKIILNFSGDIDGLTANNIILSGDVSGVTKGELTKSGSTYTLSISGFTAGGKLIVWVSKLGYTISGASKEVTIIGSGGNGGSGGSGGNGGGNSGGNGGNGGGGGGGGNNSGNVIMNGTWSRTSGGYTYSIVIGGNNWTFSEDGSGIFKGTWTSSVPPAAPSNGTITLKTTHQYSSSGWVSIPSQYAGVATNTATFSINSAGNEMTITNSASANAELWGKTEGTYTKQ